MFPFVNDKCKKCEEKIKEKHVPDLMDSSDFENAIGKSGSWFFLISYSSSNELLLARDYVILENYKITQSTDH